jgi:hypothetical protein
MEHPAKAAETLPDTQEGNKRPFVDMNNLATDEAQELRLLSALRIDVHLLHSKLCTGVI